MTHLDKNRFWLIHLLYFRLFLGLLVVFPMSMSAAQVQHQLTIKLQSDVSQLSVSNQLEFPAGTASAVFSLHQALAVTAIGAKLKQLTKPANSQHRYYQLSRLSADGKVQLDYQGKITSEKTLDSAIMPDTVFNKDQLYLDGNSAWYPRFDEFPWQNFTLNIQVPKDWHIISQGKRIAGNNQLTYHMPHAQDDIYLLGGRYHRYAQMHDDIELEVYLLKQDARLAKQYLDTTAAYISSYSDWIGAYPYAKFAVVENFWQTGYGMPSFTLLGSRVIRLPFILHTSLPHEILHNWWGNGVFVDYQDGNWSEGLTAYMADHHNREQRGTAAEYRRKALERYANFASKQRDFALAKFTSRHSQASQAVGYSKSLMLFHMLRTLSGDRQFTNRLQNFWKRYRFKTATFSDLINQLHSGSQAAQATFIRQWLYRQGALQINLANAVVKQVAEGYQLTIKINQSQDSEAYQLQIPVKILFSDKQPPVLQQLSLSEKTQQYTLTFKHQPIAIHLDPEYEVFRLLDSTERPSSLGKLFGSKQQLLIYPADATMEQNQAWQQLAALWQRKYANVKLISDQAIDQLPDNTASWLLGWNNRLLKTNQQRFLSASQQVSDTGVSIHDQHFTAGQQAVVLLDSNNTRQPLAFIGAVDPATIQLLSAKLTHYNSYGALAFSEKSATNIYKQHLDVATSVMQQSLTSPAD